MKTLEQSVMEVEEEHELSSMTSFKGAWYERLGCFSFLGLIITEAVQAEEHDGSLAGTG